MLYLDSLWGSFVFAAAFFNTSGEAVSIADPEECAAKYVPHVRAIVVGVITSVFSVCVVHGLKMLHKREFMYCDADAESDVWDPKRKAALLRKWKLLDGILIFSSSACLVFSMLYSLSNNY